MSRFSAASVHFFISAAAAALLLALFWFVWYPSPLLRAVGGTEIFMTLLAVDVVLGPLLTLVVFKSGKRTLKFDLGVIATVQVLALAYGALTLFEGRPVYVAALGIRFDVIQANQVQLSDIEAAGTSLPRWGPLWVGTREAADRKEREKILFGSVFTGADYGQMPQYHAPLESMNERLLSNAKPIAELRVKNRDQDAAIAEWLAERNHNDQTAVFQGLKARSQDMAVILDAKTAAVVGIAPFKPW